MSETRKPENTATAATSTSTSTSTTTAETTRNTKTAIWTEAQDGQAQPVSPIEVRAATTMGDDFQAQFARARQLRAKQEQQQAQARAQAQTQTSSSSSSTKQEQLIAPIKVSYEEFHKAQIKLGDETKEEEQAIRYGHQSGVADPGKVVSDGLDLFVQRVERGRGMMDVHDPMTSMKDEVLLNEANETEGH